MTSTLMQQDIEAPGWPGILPKWTSSAKTGVGTALSPLSRVWFTLSHGILNEVYYPRPDQACTRDMGLVVTDGQEFFSEEKRHARSEVACLADGGPAYRLTNTCLQGCYRLEKLIVADPQRDVVLQQTRFTPLRGTRKDYHLYVLLAPHLGNRGTGNTAWVGEYKGTPMLFAERDGTALALACSVPWLARSAGFVGVSDGWQDLVRHKQMTWHYERAANGNVALTGEIDIQAAAETEWFTLALAFGRTAAEAGQRARASLLDGFAVAQAAYMRQWQVWQDMVLPPGPDEPGSRELYRTSAMVIACHEALHAPGGIIASLSIPWGFARGDDDLGGYHLVWPRDLVEAAGGLLAVGAGQEVRRALHFLQITQEADGHWPQNMWLDGTAYWNGVQLDETSFPVLLVSQAHREGLLGGADLLRLWPMVRKALEYIACNGPVTQQDRWEEDPGYSPFTLAIEVAALLAGADLAELAAENETAAYLRETADAWNESIERWTYVTGTDLARQLGVEGYYVRIAPPEVAEAASPKHGYVPIKNRPPEQNSAQADQLVSPDALALVRFGLRAALDPRVCNTVKVIDALLKVETPYGPAWHRYNGDGYGEHEDGSPFDGTGIGRAWPLLTGERAHYELAAGRVDEAVRLLRTMEAFTNEGGMLPEQIWDAPDIQERELFFGRPSGSAMPLVWAHAEYLKLRRSLRDGRVYDMPPQPFERYVRCRTLSPYAIWRFNQKCRSMPAGKTLRIETLAPAVVHWSADSWRAVHDSPTRSTGLGVHLVDLPTTSLPAGAQVLFTFYWPEAGRWEGRDFAVIVDEGCAGSA